MKDLIFEVSNLSSIFFFKIISYKRSNIYDIHTERRWGLKICCVFTGTFVFKQQINCLHFQIGVGAEVKKLVILGWRHNSISMIPNVKKLMF